jgi:SAM-dependent methyltransferase
VAAPGDGTTAGGRSPSSTLRGLKRRSPVLYWRLRNAASLLRWSADRLLGRGENEAYDAGFYDAHQAGDWAGLARTILEFAPATRVVDVGCGDGNLLSALREVDPVLELLGLEGSRSAVRRARQRQLRVEPCDLAARRSGWLELEAFRPELAISLEVGEHIPPWRAGSFVKLLAIAPQVVFSAATPLQGGVLHLNEQPAEYWIRRFEKQAMRLSPANAEFRSAVAQLPIAPWYRDNVMLFIRA